MFEEDPLPPLETVNLSNKSYGEIQHPSLEFVQQGASGSQNDGDIPPPIPKLLESSSQMQGTEQQPARPRSRSMSLKEWGTHQLKITKQLIQERFGNGTRTVDAELEQRIESLKETQKKYAHLMALSTQLHSHFSNVIDSQKSLAEHFAFMSVRSPELHTEFHLNSETQRVISRNGETLQEAIKHFISNLRTISSKTMEDTLQTAKVYDSTRLAYDAYRTECEDLQKQAATSQKAASNLAAMSVELEKSKKKFEKLRQDVDIKLKLLDENKVK